MGDTDILFLIIYVAMGWQVPIHRSMIVSLHLKITYISCIMYNIYYILYSIYYISLNLTPVLSHFWEF